MDEKQFTTNTSNVKSKTMETEPKGVKPKPESKPCASSYQDAGLTFADGEDNGTSDGFPESVPHSDHHENVHYPDDKATDSCDHEAFVIQRLPQPIPYSGSSEQVEDVSTVVQRTSPSPQSSDDEIHVVYQNMQYSLKEIFLPLPRATGFFTVNMLHDVAVAFTLHCSSEEEFPNLDATQGPVVPVEQHFHYNRNKTGRFVYSSDVERFSGSIQYPLPKKRAEDDQIGCGESSIVFIVYFGRKEYILKKTVYRSEEVRVYSQMRHPNIVNLEAVLIGQEHEHLKNQFYAYYFMPNMGINFRNVLSANSLQFLRMQREQWGLVLCNVKYILRCVLKALDYMQSQGVMYKGIKASNVLIKMPCRCDDSNVLLCPCCLQTFAVKLALSSCITGCDPLYANQIVMMQSFGHFLLNVFIGKCARGFEDPQDIYYTNSLLGDLERYYTDTPGLHGLAYKCFQVGPTSSPKELLQSVFFS